MSHNTSHLNYQRVESLQDLNEGGSHLIDFMFEVMNPVFELFEVFGWLK